VIQPTASKKISTASLSSTLAKPAEPLQQPSPTEAPDVNSKIVTFLHISNSVTASHDMLSNNSIIVKDTREKKHILTVYQEKFGSEYPELIITRKKGKISNDTSLHRASMRPSLNKWYQLGDLHLYCHHYHHQGVKSQFLEGRHFQPLSGEQGLCKHCPKVSPLVSTPYEILVWDMSSKIISILIAWKWLVQL
jgi:hypothetical protein